MKKIDLGVLGSRVLSGRIEGHSVRASLHLNEEDLLLDKWIVTLLEDLFSLNTSYFLGLFGDSVRTLGPMKFKEKYIFENAKPYILKNIEEGIDRAMKEEKQKRKKIGFWGVWRWLKKTN